MALFDFLKRKKEIEKAEGKKPAKKTEKASVAKPAVKKVEKTESVAQQSEQKSPSKVRKSTVFSYEAVKQPHISEKATNLSEDNQYVFKVSPNYNKKEIKKSVEGIYGVDVLSVNIIKIPAKKRRLGRTEGFRKQYIKAVVKIRKDQKIEIL